MRLQCSSARSLRERLLSRSPVQMFIVVRYYQWQAIPYEESHLRLIMNLLRSSSRSCNAGGISSSSQMRSMSEKNSLCLFHRRRSVTSISFGNLKGGCTIDDMSGRALCLVLAAVYGFSSSHRWQVVSSAKRGVRVTSSLPFA